jgi:hypothetical protein
MDMNTVMYPEISGDAAMKMDMKSNGVKMKMDMKEPKMDHSTHAMVSPDIETLNYYVKISNGYHASTRRSSTRTAF